MNPFIYQEDYPVVQTKEGALRGYEWKGTCIFKGIPYAHAQRFRKPERVKPWDGVKDVQSYGYVSPLLHPEQPGGNGEMMVPHMYWPEKEDCQNLNIWTPSIRDGRKRPVMVWLHGGGFSAGSSIEQLAYDGENLSRAGDVVVVSVNHRLNVLGYLDLSPFGEKYRDSANAGNLDLIAALEWIRDNIEGFGGDPENVTLFGQSGGGVKVWSLLQMPEADGLFHKGIIESGVVDPDLLGDAEDGNGREIVKAMLAELGLEEKDVDQLETLPYDQLAQAYENAAPKVAQKGEYVGNHPHKNQSYFGDAIKHGFREETKKIPLLIGTVLGEFDFGPAISGKYEFTRKEVEEKVRDVLGEEGIELIDEFLKIYPDKAPMDLLSVDTIFREPTIRFIKERVKCPDSKIYSFQFTYEFPMFDGKIAWHCSEIPFAFHNIDKVPVCNCGEETNRLQEQICQAWVSFARTGKPEISGIEWPACADGDEAVMMLDKECRIRHNPDHELVNRLKKLQTAEHSVENVQH